MAEKTRSVLRDLGGSQIGAWVRDLNRKDCGLAGTQLHVVVVRRASLHSAFARSISLFISEICALQAHCHEAKGHDLQREIAVKNVSLGIFDPSLGIFDPARCRRNQIFWVVFRQNPARC